jgi:DNA-binding NtrC family response regulator
LTRAALARLEQDVWPGNVRELSHVIERAVTLSDGEWIDAEDLGLEETRRTVRMHDVPGEQSARLWSEETCNLDVVTRRLTVAALQKARGHKGQAAALLGVHPRTLTRMMRRYGIPEEDGDGL